MTVSSNRVYDGLRKGWVIVESRHQSGGEIAFRQHRIKRLCTSSGSYGSRDVFVESSVKFGVLFILVKRCRAEIPLTCEMFSCTASMLSVVLLKRLEPC